MSEHNEVVQKLSENTQIILAVIGPGFVFLTAALQLLNVWMQIRMKSRMVDLEKNTNSMKDRLIELTDTEAYARGLKHGEGNPRE